MLIVDLQIIKMQIEIAENSTNWRGHKTYADRKKTNLPQSNQ